MNPHYEIVFKVEFLEQCLANLAAGTTSESTFWLHLWYNCIVSWKPLCCRSLIDASALKCGAV